MFSVQVFLRALAALCCLALLLPGLSWSAESYSLILAGGRVIDPETGLDAVRHVGISNGKIRAVSEQPLAGENVIDVQGMVVAPGFIDLHTHSPTLLGQDYQLRDGVTTALELEAGSFPSNAYGELIEGQPRMNFGSSASYIWARVRVKQGVEMVDGTSSPRIIGWKGVVSAIRKLWSDERPGFSARLDTDERQEILELIDADLEAGALGIGLALDYISEGVDSAELAALFDLAGKRQVPVFVHVRRGPAGDPSGLQEILVEAKRTATSVHICHITHNAINNLEFFLAEIRRARAEGVDVTTEMFPYNAGSVFISAAAYKRNWREVYDTDYGDVEWAATGERLTEETFDEYQQNQPRGQIHNHYLEEEWTRRAIAEPGVIVVSDLLPMKSLDLNVAPHHNSFSKVLARYVREEQLLDLPTALAKMSLLPARRLEIVAPAFKHKGRIQVGADADITVFDADAILDKATYADPYQAATGISHVLVNGVPVLRDGQLREGVYPGQRLTTKTGVK
jgi:N-acyl-D-aspartate/D-glutamate deacylase